MSLLQRGLLINRHNVSSGYAYDLSILQVHNVEILKGSVPLIRLTAEHRVSGKWRCVCAFIHPIRLFLMEGINEASPSGSAVACSIALRLGIHTEMQENTWAGLRESRVPGRESRNIAHIMYFY